LPFARFAFTTWRPMNPVAPVIKTFFISQPLSAMIALMLYKGKARNK
jgi:hypothetical protein